MFMSFVSSYMQISNTRMDGPVINKIPYQWGGYPTLRSKNKENPREKPCIILELLTNDLFITTFRIYL